MHKELEFSREGRTFSVKGIAYTKVERGEKVDTFEEHEKFCVHRGGTSLVYVLIFPFMTNEDAHDLE